MMTLFKLQVIQPDAVRSLRLDSLMVEVKSYVQPIKYNTSVCLRFYHCFITVRAVDLCNG